MPTPRSGYVYFIGSDRFGWYKIGQSKNANARIRDLGILLPFKIKIFCIWKTSDRFIAEMLMHEKYSGHSINGEWFSFKATEAQAVMDDLQVFDMAKVSHALDSIKFSNISEDILQMGPGPKNALRKEVEQAMKTIRENAGADFGPEQQKTLYADARKMVLAAKGLPLD